jgi:hypothetical protein
MFPQTQTLTKNCSPDSGSYSRTWDAKIADPAREFLLVLELYLNKTGRTASLKSYCGKPVIISTPLLNQAAVSSGGQRMATAGLY